MPHLHLYSAKLCPFVQRSVIVLEEKHIPYTITYLDLANKPPKFLAISPLGKVPVLVVDHTTALFESSVISEYLDEITPPHLQVQNDPLQKALHRAWTELASSIFTDLYTLMTSPDPKRVYRTAQRIHSKLQRLEPHVQTPWFSGEPFHLIDAAIIPALQRISWMEDLHPQLSMTSNLPNIQRWTQHALQRPSVQRSLTPNILTLFHRFLQGQGSPARNEPPSYLSTFIPHTTA